MLSIVAAKYLYDYKIDVMFSDQRKGVIDLKDLIFNKGSTVFSPLQDLNKFKTFKVDYTISWSDELDIAPEFLYFKAFEKDPSLQNKFKEWGYAA
jgi:hypothetical protein